ncbi:MAG TPA: RNA polymerase sigma factor [Acidimicrobiales bacterium]|nr:RNA polymerase sigma factor [Acidimicrobiales bacterium]
MALRHDDVEQVDRFTESLRHTHAPAQAPSRDGSVDVTRDRILVERCQAGDRAAFDELYLRYQRRLYRFCMQRLGQAHDAEDVVQESFVRAWRALPRFAGERRFYPWLTVIAANLCVDTLRRRSRLTPVEESRITDADPGTYDTEDAVLHEVDSKMVATAFGQLSTRHQRVLQMREGSEWSYRQIAEHEGVGVTAVETLLWRARQALKREFLILDEAKGKVGALIGFLVVFPARAVARLPKAMKHGVSHAVDGTKNAVASLGSGAFGDFGSGALGVFGPSVAAATGAVAISVGTVLMLPVAGGPLADSGSSNPSPIVTVLPALASPIVSASGSPHTASSTGTGATGATSTGSVAGSGGSGGGTSSSVGPTGPAGPFGLGEFGIGSILNTVASAGDGPGAVSNLGSAIGGPIGGAIDGVGSAATGVAGAISPSVGAIVGGAESTIGGALTVPGASTGAGATSAGTGTSTTGSAATPTTGTSTSSPFSSTNSAVNGLTKALGLPLNLGS